MAITYTEEKSFTPQQAAELFLSVRWVVGKYPDRLHKALMNSSRVISAWDGDRLVGLIRVMDDSELVCKQCRCDGERNGYINTKGDNCRFRCSYIY